MKSAAAIILLFTAATSTAGLTWRFTHRGQPDDGIVLYGNVDLRQVELAFNGSERIAAVLVQEGDHVRRGQVLAKLDASRLEPQVAQFEAQVAVQGQALERLRNGSRPEEIAQAKANLESAKASALNAKQEYGRASALLPKSAISQSDYEQAKAALDVAHAKVVVNQKLLDLAIAGPRKEKIAEAEAKLAANQQTLDLAIAGPRKEDIAQAEAQLRAAEAQAAFLRQQLADAQLLAPMDAVVRSRIMEPGEMASPQKSVFSLAITNPKWIRAYVSEPDLGKVHSGMAASVSVDSFPDRRFDGWIGFISPTAEFTPKAVQTDELRTSLVYEVRVFVKDPTDVLRLGMPATVHLSFRALGTTSSESENDDGRR